MIVWHGTPNKFQEFDLRFSDDGFIHFGSFSQARERLEKISESGQEWILLKCEISINNPVTDMPDIGDWSDHQLLAEAILDTQTDDGLREIAKRYLNKPYRFTGTDPCLEMKVEIEALGFDGIIYSNTAEGGCESYAIFNAEQARILSRI